MNASDFYLDRRISMAVLTRLVTLPHMKFLDDTKVASASSPIRASTASPHLAA